MSVYLPDPLETLLEHEAHAQETTPGRLLTRSLADALMGTGSRTGRIVEALRGGASGVEDIVKATGVSRDFVENTLLALAQFRPNGAKSGPGVVVLTDRDGVAFWSLSAA